MKSLYPIIGVLMILNVSLCSCVQETVNKEPNATQPSTATPPHAEPEAPVKEAASLSKSYPYQYVSQKNEERKLDGQYNTLKLYCTKLPIDKELLKEFCRMNEEQWDNGVINIVVFFDNKKFARFPANPVTGGYLEERDLKHIIARYESTSFNGYRMLTIFEKNELESAGEQIDLRNK